MKAMWLALLLAVGCGTNNDNSCPAQIDIRAACTLGTECIYPRDTGDVTCTCAGNSWACTTCEDTRTCDPGAACWFSDWERDCDCSCDADGTWTCTPFYPNYGCPIGHPPM